MKIRDKAGLKKLDERTILSQNISSLDLMERAANQIVQHLIPLINTEETIHVVCGPGNNGGDGLAIGRLLIQKGYQVEIYLAKLGKQLSADCQANLIRLKNIYIPQDLSARQSFPGFKGVIIDCLTGFGFKRPVNDELRKIIAHLNSSNCPIYSVDMPSGLTEELADNQGDEIIKADRTFTFHSPKASFFCEENASCTGEWQIIDIGLEDREKKIEADYPYFIEKEDISRWYGGKRPKHAYKNQFGHLAIVAGSQKMGGACLLSTGAALRSGVGLVTVFSIGDLRNSVRIQHPGCMFETMGEKDWICGDADFSKFDAVLIGPGIGTHPETKAFAERLFQGYQKKLIIDADGLNLLSSSPEWNQYLHSDVVLTPHPGEFKRLAGNFSNGKELVENAQKYVRTTQAVLNVKGAYSTVYAADGRMGINSTGNPGMAKGGSGDVLAGLIAGFCAKGLDGWSASVAGNLIHGLAGDLARNEIGEEAMNSEDLLAFLPKAMKIVLG